MEPDETTPIPDLYADQHRRAMALQIARPLLATSGFASSQPPTLGDLICLADYILFGTNIEEIDPDSLTEEGMPEPEFPYANTANPDIDRKRTLPENFRG